MEEVRQRVPEKKEPATILVKTCTDPVAVKTYEDLKTLIGEHYPGVTFNFKQETYPLPVWRDVLGRVLNAVFAVFCLILIAIVIIPKTPYAYLISPEFMTMFRSKKWLLCGIVIAVNYLAEYLQKSGAFEIYYNDELVSSKLTDGDYPDEQTIFAFIDKKLQ
ncbi:hypothetical protein WA538_002539 [Blastocystis sp. DL]